MPCSGVPTAGSHPRFPVGSPTRCQSPFSLSSQSLGFTLFLIFLPSVHRPTVELPYAPSSALGICSGCSSLRRASSSSLQDMGSVLAEPFSNCGGRCVTPTSGHALVSVLHGPQAAVTAPGLCSSPSSTSSATSPCLGAVPAAQQPFPVPRPPLSLSLCLSPHKNNLKLATTNIKMSLLVTKNYVLTFINRSLQETT